MQVLIEATNHKEASIIRTLKEGARAIDFLDCPFIRLLADIYHMNIEEPSLLDSLSEYMDYYLICIFRMITGHIRAWEVLILPPYTGNWWKAVTGEPWLWRGIYSMDCWRTHRYARHICIKCAAVCTPPPMFPAMRFNNFTF